LSQRRRAIEALEARAPSHPQKVLLLWLIVYVTELHVTLSLCITLNGKLGK